MAAIWLLYGWVWRESHFVLYGCNTGVARVRSWWCGAGGAELVARSWRCGAEGVTGEDATSREMGRTRALKGISFVGPPDARSLLDMDDGGKVKTK